MKQSISTNRSPHSVRSIFSPLERGQGVCKCPPINHLFLLLLLLLASCTETDVVDDNRPAAGQEVDASFNLQVLASQSPQTRSITFTADGTIESDSLAVDAAVATNDSIHTKSTASLSEGQENQLSSLWVGQYDASTGIRLFNQYFSTLSGSTVNIKLKVNEAGHTSRVYFVANTADLGEVADTTTLKARTLPYGSTDEGLPDNNLCMMMGTWSGAIPSGGLDNITVQLRRLVAKISFTYDIGGSGFSFTLDSVCLRNAPTLSQVAAPTTQLTVGGMSYKDYTDLHPNAANKTYHWYLPENMAGTVSGSDAVTSEKQKTGTGVTNATCIELAGSAVQDGVSYNDVVIRFFPGNGMNNYDIVRNAHYQMKVTLVGLDASDERIMVGEMPPVTVDPTMPAEKGHKKEVQIPARPGIPWQLTLPTWLSAMVNGTTAAAGSAIKYDGPVVVTLEATEANPKAEDRAEEVKLTIGNAPNNFNLTQAGSTLEITQNASLDVTAETPSEVAFKATKGLEWTAVSNVGWILFAENTDTRGEATGQEQVLKIKADGVNQYRESREGRIVVKAGASIVAGDPPYLGLIKEIPVAQVGSKVTDCSTSNDTAAEGVGELQGSFTATKGLDWRTSVGTYTWLNVTGNGSGSGTTGEPQNITFSVALNPFKGNRHGYITVEAGHPSLGPIGTIQVDQLGSTFGLVSGSALVTSTTMEIGSGDSKFSAIIKGTKGLKWRVTPNDAGQQIAPIENGGTIAATDQEHQVVFQALKNYGARRSETFKIEVPKGDHKLEVKVTQAPDPTLTINNGILQNYIAKFGNLTAYPPFDIDGDGGSRIDSKPQVTLTLAGANSKMDGYYELQVESSQYGSTRTYQQAKDYCAGLTEGNHKNWRLPTMIELYIMWDKARGGNTDATDGDLDSKLYTAPFNASNYYWSSSVYNGTSDRRCILAFYNGGFNWNITTYRSYVRCVRDLN